MAPERVLAELRAAGPAATEAGPEGFLPEDPRELLAAHDLALVGAFVPAVLHEPGGADAIERAAGGSRRPAPASPVVAAISGDGYDSRHASPRRSGTRCSPRSTRAPRGPRATASAPCCHPHVGTVIETREDIDASWTAARSRSASTPGTCSSAASTRSRSPSAPARPVAHAHLKDVDGELCAAVRNGTVAYSDAVSRASTARSAGRGRRAAARARAREHGFAGWYVLEQDVMLDAEPANGNGPAADVRASAEYLRGILA
jgi:inosose dehydratase